MLLLFLFLSQYFAHVLPSFASLPPQSLTSVPRVFSACGAARGTPNCSAWKGKERGLEECRQYRVLFTSRARNDKRRKRISTDGLDGQRDIKAQPDPTDALNPNRLLQPPCPWYPTRGRRRPAHLHICRFVSRCGCSWCSLLQLLHKMCICTIAIGHCQGRKALSSDNQQRPVGAIAGSMAPKYTQVQGRRRWLDTSGWISSW